MKRETKEKSFIWKFWLVLDSKLGNLNVDVWFIDFDFELTELFDFQIGFHF